MSNFKLSPSDFAFLWQECSRCFYLKVARAFPRPRLPFPKIFLVIDSQMNECFDTVRTEVIAQGMPRGVVSYGQKWVRSEPISVPGTSSTCFISGRFDTVVEFDDGTYGVIDFKTSAVRGRHVSLYGRQLHAYAYALENPAAGRLGLSPVSRLGLLVFGPQAFCNSGMGQASLDGAIVWKEVPRDDAAFLAFLAEVVSLLDQPQPPSADPSCGWCQYRDASRQCGL